MVGTSILGSWRSPIEKITIPNVKSRNRPPRNELKLSQSDQTNATGLEVGHIHLT